MDTGIQSNHSALRGKVNHKYNAFSDLSAGSDPHGHGTQMAGLIAGSYVGLAGDVNLVDIRIANLHGVSLTHQILAGVDFILGLRVF